MQNRGLESWCEGHPESPRPNWPGGYSRPIPDDNISADLAREQGHNVPVRISNGEFVAHQEGPFFRVHVAGIGWMVFRAVSFTQEERMRDMLHARLPR